MKEATLKRLADEKAAYEDKYFIFLKNGVLGYNTSQENWDKIFSKKTESSK
jgi:hypothetical protein